MTDLFEAETATTTTLDLRRLAAQQATRNASQVDARRAPPSRSSSSRSARPPPTTSLAPSRPHRARWRDYEGEGQGQTQIVVNSGDTGSDIATTLHDSGVIASRQAFLEEWNANPDFSGHRARLLRHAARDEGRIRACSRCSTPITATCAPSPSQKAQTSTRSTSRLPRSRASLRAEVKAAAQDTEALGLPAEANGNLEGWLFPATYEFNPGVTPTEVLTRDGCDHRAEARRPWRSGEGQGATSSRSASLDREGSASSTRTAR